MSSEDRDQFTIAAFYGQKPSAFVAFLNDIRRIIANAPIGSSFRPYTDAQVHTTLMGLERRITSTGIYNLNLYQSTREERRMQIAGCVSLIETWIQEIKIRFGGFDQADDRFLSWNQRPYLRTFGIHKSTDKVVLNGWPVVEKDGEHQISDGIWQLRSQLCQRHHMQHKYHRFQDNDVFMVLGDFPDPYPISSRASQRFIDDREIIERHVQTFLSRSSPYYLDLTLDDIRLIRYRDPSLPPDQTHSWPVEILRSSPTFVRELLES